MKKVPKVLIFNADDCTGCKICELICSQHSNGEYNPKQSHIKVLKNWDVDVNIVALDTDCNFCGACIEWCPRKCLKFVSKEEAAIIRKQNKMGTFPAPAIKSGSGRKAI